MNTFYLKFTAAPEHKCFFMFFIVLSLLRFFVFFFIIFSGFVFCSLANFRFCALSFAIWLTKFWTAAKCLKIRNSINPTLCRSVYVCVCVSVYMCVLVFVCVRACLLVFRLLYLPLYFRCFVLYFGFYSLLLLLFL